MNIHNIYKRYQISRESVEDQQIREAWVGAAITGEKCINLHSNMRTAIQRWKNVNPKLSITEGINYSLLVCYDDKTN